jgi:hypothetical protein
MRRLTLGALLAVALLVSACGSDDDHAPTATPTATATRAATATPTPNPAAQACRDAGGTVTTGTCCAGASDFPNTCGLGVCGCSPAASRPLPLCECPGGCWNGSACTTRGAP